MNSLYQVDDLVKEYLLFRGFTSTFRALETESRTDKDKGFQVDKILEELLSFVNNGDVNGLVEYYRYLDIRFFSRLDTRFQQTIKKFELCLLRHYLVHAIQHKKRDKVKDFFDIYGPDLHGISEWSQWFALPYVKQPASDPVFETFFTKQWVDSYTTSLHNFLATIFQNMPLPSLLAFNVDRTQRKTQQMEIENLKSTVENMKATIEARENEVAKLRVELADTRKEMTDGISLIRKRAASMTAPQQKASIAKNVSNHTAQNSNTLSPSTTPNVTNTSSAAIISTDSQVSQDTNQPINDSNTNVSHQSNPDEVNDDNHNDKDNGVDDGDSSNAKNKSDNACAINEVDEPFVVVSQEEFSEHASAITHAKFSTQGNLIASCDMDNIVRVWSYKGQSHSPQKVTSNASNVLSLEWDARSDRFLFLGTDSGTLRVYNAENRSVVQEFSMTDKYPWVTQLSSSPVEPVIVCAASNSKTRRNMKQQGALVAWSMKSMSSSGVFKLDSEVTCTDINTIKHNHNGQMLVAGDGIGTMRIFDVRTMKSIVEWKTLSTKPACIARFSFDENSIYTIDHDGQLSQWSIHKPGVSLSNTYLQGFPPPPAYTPPASSRPFPLLSTPHPSLSSPANSSSTPTASTPISSSLPPRPSSNRSTSSRASVSSSRSARLSSISDEGVMQTILSTSPRSQMVAFSADTDYLLCATTANPTKQALTTSSSTSTSSSSSSASSSSASISSSLSSQSSQSSHHQANNRNNSSHSKPSTSAGETQGTIFQGSHGKPVLQFGRHHVYRKITAVDWTSASNACLLGSADGSVKVTHLIKTSY